MAPATMLQRMHKSVAKINLIGAGAQKVDVGGYAIKDAIKAGVCEIDVTMAGLDAMEVKLHDAFPMLNTATLGFGFNLGSTQMGPIIQ